MTLLVVLGRWCHLSGPQVCPTPFPAPSTPFPFHNSVVQINESMEVCWVVFNTVQEDGSTSICVLKVLQLVNERTLLNIRTRLSDDPGSPSGCRSILRSARFQAEARGGEELKKLSGFQKLCLLSFLPEIQMEFTLPHLVDRAPI